MNKANLRHSSYRFTLTVNPTSVRQFGVNNHKRHKTKLSSKIIRSIAKEGDKVSYVVHVGDEVIKFTDRLIIIKSDEAAPFRVYRNNATKEALRKYHEVGIIGMQKKSAALTANATERQHKLDKDYNERLREEHRIAEAKREARQ